MAYKNCNNLYWFFWDGSRLHDFFNHFFQTENYGVRIFICLFAVLFLLRLAIYVKNVLINGKIIVTSHGLQLIQGKRQACIAKTDIVQFEKKYQYGRSRTPHILEREGDFTSRTIACQIFPNRKMFSLKPEGVYLLTKRTTSSSGGLFDTRILSELPFFIPTHNPDELLSALQKISPCNT